ncbi:MAG: ABC transporter ATP-binding protein [Chitinophagaceae bacterium]
MLQLKNIKKEFGPHLIYSIDNLELRKGIYWIKGVNGSGKSTFLKMLAGMLPFSGDIFLGDISITKQQAAYRRKINYSPAEPSYPSFIRGNELVEFIKKLKGGNEQQVMKIKQVLGIDNYTANPTGSYSSGMLKKLSLLLAFIGDPEWILLDEPFTTLDQTSQLALTKLISQKKEEGVSFIITSHHDIESSLIPFTDIYVMNEKQLLKVS